MSREYVILGVKMNQRILIRMFLKNFTVIALENVMGFKRTLPRNHEKMLSSGI